MTTKRSESPFNLCKFAYSDGRCCGLPADPAFNGLCRSHGLPRKRDESPFTEINEDLSSYIEPFKNEPPTEAEIHSALARVFRTLSTNRISTRRAATLGYLGQLMLLKKSSKEDRETLTNISRIMTKTLDLTYNPKYGSPHRPPNTQVSPTHANSTSQRST